MHTDINKEAFFELVRAGLWEKEARLSQFDNINYAAILQLAEEQSVVGLVTAGLEHVVDVKVPQKMLLQFIGSTLQIEQQNKDMNVFLARLIEKLRKEDVYAILVKGQGIAQCYENPLWRASGDIDLLLSSNNYDRAKKVLMPLASEVEGEYTHFKHQAMTINDCVVELHGTMHSRLSRRVDKQVDAVQNDVFFGGNVRSWDNSGTIVFLPAPNNDVIFVFTHILHHFFFEGIGLRQICDWCRLLWKYREEIDRTGLAFRLDAMGILSEWKAFAMFAVEYLGMPVEAIPLYSPDARWKRKAYKICADVLKVGNFGHKREQAPGLSQPYLIRKFISFWTHLGFVLRHFTIFPKDSVAFFGGVLRSGLYAAVRGE